MTKNGVSAMLALAGLALVGCDREATAPEGRIRLERLAFLESEVAAGDPLVLVARPAAGESLSSQGFLLRTSSGLRQDEVFPAPCTDGLPWACVTDEELAAVIDKYDDIVLIGFKEAGAERGVDEQGTNITSEETVLEMQQWVEQQGVTITREWLLRPGVTGTMPGDAALVSRLRSHENTDSVEPGGLPGAPLGGAAPVAAGDLLTVIETGSVRESELAVEPGDVVTAEYRQPDGSLLTASVSIRR